MHRTWSLVCVVIVVASAMTWWMWPRGERGVVVGARVNVAPNGDEVWRWVLEDGREDSGPSLGTPGLPGHTDRTVREEGDSTRLVVVEINGHPDAGVLGFELETEQGGVVSVDGVAVWYPHATRFGVRRDLAGGSKPLEVMVRLPRCDTLDMVVAWRFSGGEVRQWLRGVPKHLTVEDTVAFWLEVRDTIVQQHELPRCCPKKRMTIWQDGE